VSSFGRRQPNGNMSSRGNGSIRGPSVGAKAKGGAVETMQCWVEIQSTPNGETTLASKPEKIEKDGFADRFDRKTELI